MRTQKWDLRYAAAGLGWGAAIGVLTGMLFATAAAASLFFDDGVGDLSGLMFLLLAPLYGAVYGVVPGAIIGLVAGTATALTAGGVLDPRRAWRTAFFTTLVVGCAAGVALFIAMGMSASPMVLWPFALLILPTTLGAWLMARTTRSFIASTHRHTSPAKA